MEDFILINLSLLVKQNHYIKRLLRGLAMPVPALLRKTSVSEAGQTLWKTLGGNEGRSNARLTGGRRFGRRRFFSVRPIEDLLPHSFELFYVFSRAFRVDLQQHLDQGGPDLYVAHFKASKSHV